MMTSGLPSIVSSMYFLCAQRICAEKSVIPFPWCFVCDSRDLRAHGFCVNGMAGIAAAPCSIPVVKLLTAILREGVASARCHSFTTSVRILALS